jgi:mannose-1-phosphate guanylyltransferase
MDAVLLVGGQGTRLRPLTATTPKPMLPTAGVPFLTHLLVRARDAGVDHAILSTAYRPEVFRSHFGDGADLGLRITYVHETTPLGTGGGIRNVAAHLRGDAFLVFNGDVLSGADLRALVAAHRDRGAEATLHLTEVPDARAFGCVPTDADGWVTAFLEKMPEPVTNRINAGCYVFNASVLDRIPAGRPVSVERETFPALLADGARVYGHVDTAYWLDLGTPEAFVRGCRDLVLGTVASAALPGAPGECLVLRGAAIADDAVAVGGTTVGRRARVGAGAYVSGSVLFDDADVGSGARVADSVIGRGAVVGEGTVLTGVVVGDGARIGARNELVDGARVWPNVVLPDGAVRFSSDA